MTGMFDAATAVRRVDEHRFEADVRPGWDIGGHANGGYLLALAGRAMTEVAGRSPLTLTSHFFRPAPAGPCTIDVEVVRSGRRLATLRGSLWQGDKQVLSLLGTFGDQVATDAPPTYLDGGAPTLPPWAESVEPPDPPGSDGPSIFRQLAVRLRPGDEGFRTGVKTGKAQIAGWFSFADEAPVDPIGLLFVCDAFPPPIFNTDAPVAWVPTIELTVHVRGVPVAGPLCCIFTSRFVQGDMVEEDGEVWDSADRLVAQSRQISLTPRP